MKNAACWEKNLLELLRRTSMDLPSDVELALRRALKRARKGSFAAWALDTILQSAAVSRSGSLPLCQDSGTLLFYFSVPVGFDTNAVASVARSAVAKATRLGYLRENTVDSVTGAPFSGNVAHGSPVFHFVQGARKTIDARLVLKGGGSENVGTQYALPDESIGAGRDMDGVRRCILDAVHRAQGNGCAPGVLGVCIGGDRATGYAHSKEQFLRRITDRSPVRALARLESAVLRDAETLRIGPMGLGGAPTLLGVKVGSLSRLPASYFVTVSYMCWAFRRRGAVFGPEGGVHRWLY
jgi:fumarate hydratase class I